MADLNLPAKMRALILKSTSEAPTVETVPTPTATQGTAVIRILAATVTNFMQAVYQGQRPFPIPKPMIPGTSAVARVVSTGQDATHVKPGDLVFFDCFIRARDKPVDTYLSAVPFALSKGGQKIRENFGEGAFAEYCLVPLENLIVLNESMLIGAPDAGGLGYNIETLALITMLLVPFGGLQVMHLKAGETIIIGPATGSFGGCAVICAQAMGAHVIALGRNQNALDNLKSIATHPKRLTTVKLSGDVEADSKALSELGQSDAFLDIGPPQAHESSHLKAAISSLRPDGRVCFMGGYSGDVSIPYNVIMTRNLQIFGRYMYEREDIAQLVNLVEKGLLDLKVCQQASTFGLDQWQRAWREASEKPVLEHLVVITPEKI